MNARAVLTMLLLSLMGCAQMLGDLFGWPTFKAAAQLSQVSPAMKVFTAHRGYETYAARFYLERIEGDDREVIELTRDRYRGLRGPYNRRNVYGAAFSYGPLLASDPRLAALHRSVLRYGLCMPGTAIAELGLKPAPRWRVIAVPHRAAPAELPLIQEVNCDAP